MEQGGHVVMVYIMVKIHPVLCEGMEGQDYSQFWLVLAGELHDEGCFCCSWFIADTGREKSTDLLSAIV